MSNAPAVKQVLCALLWEEIRPVQQVELTWPADEQRRPAPEELTITTLDNQGTASSWWNNLKAAEEAVKPTVADGRSKLVYELSHNTCGLVISVGGDKLAAEYAVPTVRVLVADTWKKMDVEIEWGYDAAPRRRTTAGGSKPMTAWWADWLRWTATPARRLATALRGVRRQGRPAPRREGQSAVPGHVEVAEGDPFTSQPDDVARTIVTVWTKAGNFSFLAADLENGPILAPEYGFFVRRTSALPAPVPAASAVRGSAASTCWRPRWTPSPAARNCAAGAATTPWFGGNPTDQPVTVERHHHSARGLAMHPGATATWPWLGAARSRQGRSQGSVAQPARRRQRHRRGGSCTRRREDEHAGPRRAGGTRFADDPRTPRS